MVFAAGSPVVKRKSAAKDGSQLSPPTPRHHHQPSPRPSPRAISRDNGPSMLYKITFLALLGCMAYLSFFLSQSHGEYQQIAALSKPRLEPVERRAEEQPPKKEPQKQWNKGEQPKQKNQKQQDQKQQKRQPPQEKRGPTTIAYAISLIKCGDKQSTSAGLVDAALVLQHSVHLQSSRVGASRYDYKMYAIVHRDAVECSGILEEAGFTIVVKDPPVQPAQIRGEHLRENIRKEWCCGADEFVKLYAFELPGGEEPVVVHVDIDFVFLQPMDYLFDALLQRKDSPGGKAARKRIPLERPNDPWPDKVDAFITRDYPQLLPGRIPGYQAGFLVARRDTTVVPQILDIIREGDYDGGFRRNNGWGHKGYGGYVGAMAMQGLMAYYYDIVRPNTTMELGSCRFNHMGMDNLYRAQPNFKANSPYVGKCRSTREDCEDCTTTDIDKIYNVHYTQCRKPWNCVSLGADGGNEGQAIDTTTGQLEHCLELTTKWHEVRQDLEHRLYQHTGDQLMLDGISGEYKKDLFLGHCRGEGQGQYLQLQGSDGIFSKIPSLYKEGETMTTTIHKVESEDSALPPQPKTSLQSTSTEAVVEAVRSKESLVTIAYAVGLQKCDIDNQKFLDALVVLRHSVYSHSWRNPDSGSKYNYKLYAIRPRTNRDHCAKVLKKLGYQVVIGEAPELTHMPTPNQKKTDRFSYGSSKNEFLQLHAYNLTTASSFPEPIVVLMDPETAIYKPLDVLFDAMLLDGNTPEGRAARAKIPMERKDDQVPQRIEAMFSRDYHYAEPESGLPHQYLTGFLVLRQDKDRAKDLLELARDQEKQFVHVPTSEGEDKTVSGWGGKGYIKAGMSGLIAYYYDVLRPGVSVELNACRFNHIGMDNLYRAMPKYHPKAHKKWIGKCRSMRSDCEECLKTPLEDIYTAHFTAQCRHPQECVTEGDSRGGPGRDLIDSASGTVEHCLEVNGHWHEMRRDFESTLLNAASTGVAKVGYQGKHKPKVFQGHCSAEGTDGYLPIDNLDEHMDLLRTLYDYPAAIAR